jgi:7-carboxy-7-deazaguanine synthase
MRIAEIFYSIQGEGLLTGVPSVFVRTSGCNLRCRWCDTMYASWKPEGEKMTTEAIIAEVEKHPASHVVLTGGEPMVAKGIRELAGELSSSGKHITIETAGTVAPDNIVCDLASISPKLANSTPRLGEIDETWIEKHERLRLQPDVLREWIDGYACQLKFVIAGEDDMAEIDKILASFSRDIPSERILLMPEGTDADTLRTRSGFVVELCRQRGFRYCPRLHIELFGNSRGT